MSALATRINAVLESNILLASRIADIQSQIECSNCRTTSTSYVPLNTIDENLPVQPTKLPIEPSTSPLYASSSNDDFDQSLRRELYESRVYARNKHRFSHNSVSLSVVQSLDYSLLSKYSLADVSILSVVRLPIYSYDLWHPQYYQIYDHGRPQLREDRLLPETASTTTTMTGLDSLIGNLLVRGAPDYKIALLG